MGNFASLQSPGRDDPLVGSLREKISGHRTRPLVALHDLPDPRRYPDPDAASPGAAALHALAARSLTAATAQDADALDGAIASTLDAMLARGDGDALTDVLDSASTPAVYRHLWRSLSRTASVARGAGDGLAVTLFAIPLVIVAATSAERGTPARLQGAVPDVEALVAVLREHGALSGNRAFALGNALVTADAIDVAQLPSLLASRRLLEGAGLAPLALAAAPIELTGAERAHLRFLVGSAIAAPTADLLADASVGSWGMPLANSLISQLSAPGASVVALPRAALSLPAAVAQGRAAQREISAQLFVSNALRALRASVGEPVAVISAHRADDAPVGGELRLSLSSPFSPRDAQGFRCPLYRGEGVAAVAMMLADLLRDCRVADVRVLDGVHPDRDRLTGGPLLFKADAL